MTTNLRNCDHCITEYQFKPAEINRGQGLYCSIRCASLASAAVKRANRAPNTECGTCKSAIYIKPSKIAKSKSGLNFCNRQCLLDAYKTGIIHSGPKRLKQTRNYNGKYNCRVCLSPVTNSDTHDIHIKCKIVEQWLAGDNECTLSASATGVVRETRRFVKQHIIRIRGNKCEQCCFDKTTPDGRSIIQMDHINGKCFDNRPENLRLLCPNCHAMTPTYGSKNKNSDRSLRRRFSL